MEPWEPAARALGVRVRELRSKRGWSQEELAGQARLHRTYIADIERGKRNPSLWTIVRIARALGCPVRDLFPNQN